MKLKPIAVQLYSWQHHGKFHFPPPMAETPWVGEKAKKELLYIQYNRFVTWKKLWRAHFLLMYSSSCSTDCNISGIQYLHSSPLTLFHISHLLPLLLFCITSVTVKIEVAFVTSFLCHLSCTELERQAQALQLHSVFKQQRCRCLNVCLNVILALRLPGWSAAYCSIKSLCSTTLWWQQSI